MGHLLGRVEHQALVIWGDQDQVLSDVPGSVRAAGRMANARQVVISNCGHAPQIEKARLVNHLVTRFLRDNLKTVPPALDPNRYLLRHETKMRSSYRRETVTLKTR